jgi:hypothetical protein
MILWAVITVLLLLGNAIYCVVHIMADFGGPRPARGVWGLLALAYPSGGGRLVWHVNDRS